MFELHGGGAEPAISGTSDVVPISARRWRCANVISATTSTTLSDASGELVGNPHRDQRHGRRGRRIRHPLRAATRSAASGGRGEISGNALTGDLGAGNALVGDVGPNWPKPPRSRTATPETWFSRTSSAERAGSTRLMATVAYHGRHDRRQPHRRQSRQCGAGNVFAGDATSFARGRARSGNGFQHGSNRQRDRPRRHRMGNDTGVAIHGANTTGRPRTGGVVPSRRKSTGNAAGGTIGRPDGTTSALNAASAEGVPDKRRGIGEGKRRRNTTATGGLRRVRHRETIVENGAASPTIALNDPTRSVRNHGRRDVGRTK